MNERPKIKIEEGNVREISYYRSPGGVLEFRELLIRGSGTTTYRLSVGTPEYVWSIRSQNARVKDPSLKIDENIIAMADLENLQQVLERLRQIPPENLAPYLEELENPTPAA